MAALKYPLFSPLVRFLIAYFPWACFFWRTKELWLPYKHLITEWGMDGYEYWDGYLGAFDQRRGV